MIYVPVKVLTLQTRPVVRLSTYPTIIIPYKPSRNHALLPGGFCLPFGSPAVEIGDSHALLFRPPFYKKKTLSLHSCTPNPKQAHQTQHIKRLLVWRQVHVPEALGLLWLQHPSLNTHSHTQDQEATLCILLFTDTPTIFIYTTVIIQIFHSFVERVAITAFVIRYKHCFVALCCRVFIFTLEFSSCHFASTQFTFLCAPL